MNKPILYFNGDSFTAGSELADHLLPDWPGLYKEYSLEQFNKNFDWRHRYYNNYKFKPLIDKIEIQEKKYAYPFKLATKLDLQYKDNSKGGASLDRIVRTSILDLIELKKTNSNIIAVIGMTGIDRFEIGYYKNEWMSVLLSVPSPDSKIDVIRKTRVLCENNYHNFTRYFLNLLNLKNFCLANNIQIYFVDTFIEQDIEKYAKEQELKDLWKSIDLDFVCSMSILAETLPAGEYKYCPCGHFVEKVHDIVANYLAEKIIL